MYTQNLRKIDSLRTIAYLAVSWVLLDSMMTYFSRTFLGTYLPVSAALPFILLIVVWRWKLSVILPPPRITAALFIGFVGFSLGIITQEHEGVVRMGGVVLSVSAFLVGYLAFRWSDSDKAFATIFLWIGGAYVVVCLLALLNVAPSIFPVIDAVWSDKGILRNRPEVMTDQNFQVFYLFILVPLLMLPFSTVRFAMTTLAVVGAFFVLAKLQTRSGVLVLSAVVIMAWLAPLWTRSLGRTKLMVYPVLFILAVAINIETIIGIASLLIERFTGAETTGALTGGRLESNIYFLERVWNPAWWIPRGYSEFMDLHGGTIPHSNIAAMFLEGGILGLYMWIVVFAFPLIRFLTLFFKRQLDDLSTMVLLCGVASFVLQLSLNVPFFKQPWLWAGAVVGSIYRLKEKQQPTKQTERPRFVPLPSSKPAR